ncbi:MAG: hypothetical protein M1816_001536 [Peltula sp. TS41687]|nr:MAG: hypothetical protein M1816_001536 [Peltula sp. TS41687]
MSPANLSLSTHPGVLHRYAPKLVAFEHANPAATTTTPLNTLLFISGLGDGLLTVPYTSRIASSLPAHWSLAEVLISSSYTGWGISSLRQDASELARCVSHFRQLRPQGKIVLMGHSTGCQDTMWYLTGTNSTSRPALDGAMLQTPSSDREAMVDMLAPGLYDESVQTARRMVEAGEGEEIIPRRFTACFGGVPCTARRWLSLASPDKDGEDDRFSSDLRDEQLAETFGRVPGATPLCVLLSGEDEYTPRFVDKGAVLDRWIGLVKRGGGSVDEELSGVIPGATHSLIEDPDEVREDLVRRVVSFVERCEAGLGEGS